VRLELSCGSREVGRLAVDDVNDGDVAVVVVVAVAVPVAAIVVDEAVGSFSVVVADVAAVCGAVAVVFVVVAAAIEEDDDECNVAFAIGLDAAVVAVIAETFLPPPPATIVVFLTLAESPFDDAGTADAVISNNARQTQH